MKKVILLSLLLLFVSPAFAQGDETAAKITNQAAVNTKSPQWGPYMKELEAKIKSNWHPPKGDQFKRVVLLFSIGRGGELLSVKVQKSSGSPESDKAAQTAVQMSAPFRALPSEYKGKSVDVDFTFDYNVINPTTKLTPLYDTTTVEDVNQTTPEVHPAQWNAYLKMADTRIKNNWNPSKIDNSKMISAKFTVEKNGEITNIRFTRLSGIKELDNAALDAIKKASPLEPLPKEFTGKNVDIDYFFVKHNIVSKTNKNMRYYTYEDLHNIHTEKYREEVYKKIVAETWEPVSFAIDPYTKNNVVAKVTINKKGELVKYEITHSKGKKADEAAINAIKKAAPFGEFPPEIKAETDTFTINFNYSKAKNRK